jgi:hydroxyacylglutathione hydrolase
MQRGAVWYGLGMVEIIPVALLTDNYAYLVHSGATTVVIDPSEAAPVDHALRERGWKANAILNTHHHWDHVNGNAALKAAYGCEVICGRGDIGRVDAADREMEGGQKLVIGELSFDVLFIPGHTLHHVALWLPEEQAVFTGDALFLMGCGRLFEGTAAQMLESLLLLAKLPDATRVYCGHEYTQNNAEFSLAVTPDDAVVKARVEQVLAARKKGAFTVPGTIAQEKATNPFIRVADSAFREKLYPGVDAVTAFARLRARKDTF